MYKLFNIKASLVILYLIYCTYSLSAIALTSNCVKFPGITIGHEVTWTLIEGITFNSTTYQTNATGPNAPFPGVTAFSTAATNSSQPVGHYLFGWIPGNWQILGDAGQFAVIGIYPDFQIIFNPNPSGCIEDYVLP